MIAAPIGAWPCRRIPHKPFMMCQIGPVSSEAAAQRGLSDRTLVWFALFLVVTKLENRPIRS